MRVRISSACSKPSSVLAASMGLLPCRDGFGAPSHASAFSRFANTSPARTDNEMKRVGGRTSLISVFVGVVATIGLTSTIRPDGPVHIRPASTVIRRARRAKVQSLTRKCSKVICYKQEVRKGVALLVLFPLGLFSAPKWLLIRTIDGATLEGQSALKALRIEVEGRPAELRVSQILSVHSGAAASDVEAERIKLGLAAVQGKDRKERDIAVEELTSIGLPVVTPLLDTLKDTDQHEPRPLYRLFERLMPSYADGFDRTLSLVRLQNGGAVRGRLPDEAIDLVTNGGSKMSLPWSKIRTLAVRQERVDRAVPVHSLRHCTQIEYLDTGIVLTQSSKIDSAARGFVRLSWNVDGWACDADGLKKPGAPAYKTNLVDGHPFGALVGRIGAGGQVFFLGKKATKTGVTPGRLALAVNDNGHWQNNLGTFSVTLTTTDAYDTGDAQ